jgi:nitrogen fixation protein FixH
MSHLGRIVLVVAALLLLVVSSGTAAGLQIKSAGNPDQIPLGETPLRFQVTDAQGAPVTGARVALEVSLPAVPHVLPSTIDAIATNEPGLYAAYVNLEQDGRWQVKVTAKAAGRPAPD